MSKGKLILLAIGLMILSVVGMAMQDEDQPVHHAHSANTLKDTQGLKAAGQAYTSYLDGGN